MQLGLTKQQAVKILKTAAYVGLSAIVAYALALTTDHPEYFGVWAGVINIALVALKQFLSASQE